MGRIMESFYIDLFSPFIGGSRSCIEIKIKIKLLTAEDRYAIFDQKTSKKGNHQGFNRHVKTSDYLIFKLKTDNKTYNPQSEDYMSNSVFLSYKEFPLFLDGLSKIKNSFNTWFKRTNENQYEIIGSDKVIINTIGGFITFWPVVSINDNYKEAMDNTGEPMIAISLNRSTEYSFCCLNDFLSMYLNLKNIYTLISSAKISALQMFEYSYEQ